MIILHGNRSQEENAGGGVSVSVSAHDPGSLPTEQMDASTASSATHGHPVEPSRRLVPVDPFAVAAPKSREYTMEDIMEFIRQVEEAPLFPRCDCPSAVAAFEKASESEQDLVIGAIRRMVLIAPWGFSKKCLRSDGSPAFDSHAGCKSLADLCSVIKSRHFRALAGIYCVSKFKTNAASHFPFTVSRTATGEERLKEERRNNRLLEDCKVFVNSQENVSICERLLGVRKD